MKYSRDWRRELGHCTAQAKFLGVKGYRERRRLDCIKQLFMNSEVWVLVKAEEKISWQCGK